MTVAGPGVREEALQGVAGLGGKKRAEPDVSAPYGMPLKTRIPLFV
tara:strand:+ start:5788 stop:5925 length:138 start_codon:yes stop_codon:yes gene_type:complete